MKRPWSARAIMILAHPIGRLRACSPPRGVLEFAAPKAEQISARRFHQRIKLAAPSDVDSELERWLADAYALSG